MIDFGRALLAVWSSLESSDAEMLADFINEALEVADTRYYEGTVTVSAALHGVDLVAVGRNVKSRYRGGGSSSRGGGRPPPRKRVGFSGGHTPPAKHRRAATSDSSSDEDSPPRPKAKPRSGGGGGDCDGASPSHQLPLGLDDEGVSGN